LHPNCPNFGKKISPKVRSLIDELEKEIELLDKKNAENIKKEEQKDESDTNCCVKNGHKKTISTMEFEKEQILKESNEIWRYLAIRTILKEKEYRKIKEISSEEEKNQSSALINDASKKLFKLSNETEYEQLTNYHL